MTGACPVNTDLIKRVNVRTTTTTNAGSVDAMTSVLIETLLSNAAEIAPLIRRKQVQTGRCATEETKAELHARWQDRQDARKRVCSAQTIVTYGEP